MFIFHVKPSRYIVVIYSNTILVINDVHGGAGRALEREGGDGIKVE